MRGCNCCDCLFRHVMKPSQSMCSQLHLAFVSSHLLMSTMTQTAWSAWMTYGAPYSCPAATVCVAKAVQKQWCRSTNTAQSVARLLMASAPLDYRHIPCPAEGISVIPHFKAGPELSCAFWPRPEMVPRTSTTSIRLLTLPAGTAML